MPSLKDYRLALGLTQEDVARRTGASQAAYSDIEAGRTQFPRPELRREICNVLGIRHVDLLVAIGQLEDWEVPGFSADMPPRDPDLERRLALVEAIDLHRDNRGTVLDVVLAQWAAQDRQDAAHPPQHNEAHA